MNKLIVSGIAVAAALSSAPAFAGNINFNALASATTYTPTNIDIDGYTFTADPSDTLLIWGSDFASYNADSNGATLSTQSGNQSVTVTRDGGGAFTLASLDLTDVYNSVFGYSGDVAITFNYQGGGSATQTVSLDALPGLQTFTFDQSNLTSFSLAGVSTVNGLFQMDNVRVSAADAAAVPEAGTWVMMMMGFGLMGAALRRRRTSLTFA